MFVKRQQGLALFARRDLWGDLTGTVQTVVDDVTHVIPPPALGIVDCAGYLACKALTCSKDWLCPMADQLCPFAGHC